MPAPGGGPAYSKLTLALLQDSGWYMPNYENAEELKWGKGLGCAFINSRCEDGWPKTEDGGVH